MAHVVNHFQTELVSYFTFLLGFHICVKKYIYVANEVVVVQFYGNVMFFNLELLKTNIYMCKKQI